MIRPSRELVEAVAKQLSEIDVRDTELLPTEEFKDGVRYKVISN